MQFPHIEHVLLAASPLLVRSLVHHLYHKAVHWLIHSTGHKFHSVGSLLSKCKWLTDALLIGALALFGAVTEHDSEPAAESNPTDTVTKSE
jgi:hypothetical protein